MTISWTPGPPPDAMKDGREVLVWAYYKAVVVRWDGFGWVAYDDDWLFDGEIAHWSEANPPEGAE